MLRLTEESVGNDYSIKVQMCILIILTQALEFNRTATFTTAYPAASENTELELYKNFVAIFFIAVKVLWNRCF